MSKTLFGTVEIRLGEETYTLTPTLSAVRAIEAHFGGLRGASQAISSLSIEGCAVIIAGGAGLSGKAAAPISEQVWQEGVLEVATQLNAYLVALYNPRGAQPGKDQPAKA
ncbi:hypothetical protein HX787_20200 [Pseudomonas tolaasii]|uniref:Uncharacterized protein n=2 Tax=Pseudomonas tolaasii TaxID=29442 RepID=A0A7Y8APX6_PSETO|nr:hypothetical protein [Pseudomonas tolaasii]ARB26227.1 hypothetical protein B5P22_02620 [Pseudomonas tolaasii]KAB0478543.1 hypothetical protein F7R12_04635 [Pseudomonas tolaasii]MBW1251076.1 hypothetical protein [Pseudomonas tolaasii]NWC23267.1 hypothetical protein [Pseudomonas tolaasii]NWC37792.1 hypothetical protein [Pseudomonas tolaasii]